MLDPCLPDTNTQHPTPNTQHPRPDTHDRTPKRPQCMTTTPKFRRRVACFLPHINVSSQMATCTAHHLPQHPTALVPRRPLPSTPLDPTLYKRGSPAPKMQYTPPIRTSSSKAPHSPKGETWLVWQSRIPFDQSANMPICAERILPRPDKVH